MIISHTHRFIFFAAGRTGTTSIEHILEPLGAPFELTPREALLFNKHMPPAILRRRVNPDLWNSYFKFAFVRNPWDWIVSRYFHARQTKNDTTAPRSRLSVQDVLDICYMKGVSRGVTWAEYRQQYAFLSDERGTLQVDFVGKFENLQADFDFICDKIGFAKTQLPELNRTRHDDYRSYYDTDARDLVAKLFRRDIEAFAYDFES